MTTLHIDPSSHAKDVADLYGIFFEDLNHAADGGLYGELVRNRAFEFCPQDNAAYTALTAWEPRHGTGEVRLSVTSGRAVDRGNPHYLALDIIAAGAGTGFWNLGYNSGIPLCAGAVYRFSCYVRREQDFALPLTVSLAAADGTSYTSATFYASADWNLVSLELTAPADDDGARLQITAGGIGRLYFDFVSLFPRDTFRGRKNGLRADLAERLFALRPRFMRFPGGCLVHDGALDAASHDAQYRWKNSVGAVESRPSRRNNWGYNQSLGLGFYEYFLLAEDIGAKPLPVLPAGYDPHHHRACPMEEMAPFVQDALDLIDFANGDDSTEWGRRRAELGHPAPFGLEYLGIGNEEVGADFPPRFKLIRDAVKAAHPEIRVIGSSGPFAAGGEFERGWNAAKADGADLVDEHYYMAPEWMLAHIDRYDAYPVRAPKVFLGEYASWANRWQNALYEAAYMTALEKAPAVALACYAPLFCNVGYANWKPDLIFFDNHRSFVTANYEVQRLFMHHTGTHLLSARAQTDDAPVFPADDGGFTGEIGVEWIKADAEFTNITLTEWKDSAPTNATTANVCAHRDCSDRAGDDERAAAKANASDGSGNSNGNACTAATADGAHTATQAETRADSKGSVQSGDRNDCACTTATAATADACAHRDCSAPAPFPAGMSAADAACMMDAGGSALAESALPADGRTRTLSGAAVSETVRTVSLAATSARRWLLRLTARETASKQGFRIYFGKRDVDGKPRRYYWELGGWQNQDAAICEELRTGEPSTCLEQQAFSVERGRPYTLELRAADRDIRAFVDGKPLHACRDTLPVLQPLYWTCSADDRAVYIKAVNVTESAKTLRAVIDTSTAPQADTRADCDNGTQSSDRNSNACTATTAATADGAPATTKADARADCDNGIQSSDRNGNACTTPTTTATADVSAALARKAHVTLLTAPLDAENGFDCTPVAPQTHTVALAASADGSPLLEYTLPPHSVCAFRVEK